MSFTKNANAPIAMNWILLEDRVTREDSPFDNIFLLIGMATSPHAPLFVRLTVGAPAAARTLRRPLHALVRHFWNWQNHL
jgi:hypothetical protein